MAIAESFFEICDLPFQVLSFEKRDPPYPDILCFGTKSEKISFELVELIDQGYAKKFETQFKLRNAIDEFLFKDGLEYKKNIHNNYSNATISFDFSDEASIREKINSFQYLFALLDSQQKNFTGKIDISDNAVKKICKALEISRGRYNGPIFNIDVYGSFGNPVTKTIKSKFKKTYKKDCPIHLLAYITHSPMFPEDHWLPQAKEFIEYNKELNPFEKIWFFHFYGKRIVWSG